MSKILCACEESQAVCVELRKLGHEAYSGDLMTCSGNHPEWHIQGDVLGLLNGRVEFETQDGFKHKVEGKWDGIVAFPPCTHLAVSGIDNMSFRYTLDIIRLSKMLFSAG